MMADQNGPARPGKQLSPALKALLTDDLQVVNIGVPDFARTLASVKAPHIHLEWKPPAAGDPQAVEVLESLDPHLETMAAANQKALDLILGAQPVLVDVRPARDVLPGYEGRLLLHAGPPVEWSEMCGPMRGAVIGAILFEKWADTPAAAEKLAAAGDIQFAPNHHYSAVGPMAGVTAPSMPVLVVENQAAGNRAYCNLNEGLGKALRFGAYGSEVLERLAWMRDVLGPALAAAVRAAGGIDLKGITARALQMGDEAHNRNAAATSLLVRELFAPLVEEADPRQLAGIGRFLAGNDHFFLNFSMAACKATMDAAHGIENASIVTAMARNGTEFGLRLSGTGDEWFTVPAQAVDALFFPGYSKDDAAPDIGDSTITETTGLGGFAMASAPAIVQFVGGNSSDALAYTREMRSITLGENQSYAIPVLDFAGTPTGIDAFKVVDTGIQPVLNTGVAHKDPGVGQIGAGVTRAPMDCFVQALRALAQKMTRPAPR